MVRTVLFGNANLGRILSDVKISEIKVWEEAGVTKCKGSEIGACFVDLRERMIGDNAREMINGYIA